MKGIIVLSTCLFSLTTFASTDLNGLSDAEVCKQYGHDLAWNIKPTESRFLHQVVSRTQDGSWSISTEECNSLIQVAKHDANFEIADMLNND